MIGFEKYKKIANDISRAADSLWNRVTFITVSEIIANEVDLRQLDKSCWELKDRLSNAQRRLTSELDALPEDVYDSVYAEATATEDQFYLADDKLSAVDKVIDGLKSIGDSIEEEEIAAKFGDTSIRLSESIIRLARIK